MARQRIMAQANASSNIIGAAAEASKHRGAHQRASRGIIKWHGMAP